jgi:signal peptidase II
MATMTTGRRRWSSGPAVDSPDVQGQEPLRDRRSGLVAFGVAAAVMLGIAQLGSYLVVSHLRLGETYVVNGVLHLTQIRNTGGVFGMFPGHGAAFAVVSGVSVAGLVLYVVMSTSLARYQYACLGLIVAAALGNTCDRLVYGSVVDFIDVQGIPHWHYIFNIADCAIHLGGWPLVIGALRRGRV